MVRAIRVLEQKLLILCNTLRTAGQIDILTRRRPIGKQEGGDCERSDRAQGHPESIGEPEQNRLPSTFLVNHGAANNCLDICETLIPERWYPVKTPSPHDCPLLFVPAQYANWSGSRKCAERVDVDSSARDDMPGEHVSSQRSVRCSLRRFWARRSRRLS